MIKLDPFSASNPSPQQNTATLHTPDNVITLVFKYLEDRKSIVKCGLVCKHWAILSAEDTVWKTLFSSRFPGIEKDKDYKLAYKEQCLFHRNLTEEIYASSTLEGHQMLGVSLDVVGKLLVSSDHSGTIKVWDIASKRYIGNIQDNPSYASFQVRSSTVANGKLCASFRDNTIRIWDIESRQLIKILTLQQPCFSLAASKGKFFLSSSNLIQVYDLTSFTFISNLQTDDFSVVKLVAAKEELISVHGDGTINIWNIESNQHIGTLQGLRSSPKSSLVVDNLLIVGNFGKTIQIWNIPSRQHVTTLTGHEAVVSELAVTDGVLFSVCSRYLKVWDLASFQCMTTMRRWNLHIDAISAIDGKLFLFPLRLDNAIEIWDFKASDDTIFEEIAARLESHDDHGTIEYAIQLFSKMPNSAKNAIYKELGKILQKRLPNNHWATGEEASCWDVSTNLEKAQAIRNYLAANLR